MHDVRLDHGARRGVLQVRQLRHHERLRLSRSWVPALSEVEGRDNESHR